MSFSETAGLTIAEKAKSVLREEARYEQWVSWIRLALAGLAGVAFIILFVLGKSSLVAFEIQVVTVSVMCIYSSYCLLKFDQAGTRMSASYLFTFLDVSAVSAILWAVSLNRGNPTGAYTGLSGLYLVLIALTALYHRLSLPVFAGVVAIAQYSFLYIFVISPGVMPLHDVTFIINISLGVVLSFVCTIICLNNHAAISKTITSEMRYQNLVQRLPEMLFTLDEQGKFIWANMAAFAIVGIPADRLNGKSFREILVVSTDFKFKREFIKQTLEIKDPHGEKRFVDCSMRPVKDSLDQMNGYEGTLTDVTDRETAISQREEMANRLYQYQKMESLSTLASGMAHDFNNVLQTIADIVGEVDKDTQESVTRERMDLLEEALADAKFMTSELMALGKNIPLDYRPINLQDFFAAITAQFKAQLGPKFDVVVIAPKERVAVQGDPAYLKRVFQNLVNNSRDVMPNGGKITLEYAPIRKDGEASLVVIRFSDEGSGIPFEVKDMIFDPFFTTKKAGKGTGLGLALVSRIISLHHGRVSVEKTSIRGTTFRMELPESDLETEELDTRQIMLNRQNTSVLVLDDDIRLREILRIFISSLGYIAIEASSIESAAGLLMKNKATCDVLIMDWNLGADDPHDVIARLRGIKSELAVIVVSGYAPRKKNIDEMNIQKWLTKPYDKHVLDIEIQKALYRLRKLKKT